MNLPPISLYVHLPWCERKCPYCDFNSHETDAIPEASYTDALAEDLAYDIARIGDRDISSVFFGGGTPSLFSARAIDAILQRFQEVVSFTQDCEITLEANPGSAEVDRFKGYRNAGVNRLSLGIQSFDDTCLSALGRVHNAAQAHAAVAGAIDAGFSNFNLDLMHGLPGQEAASAVKDLQEALHYDPPHISWYQLTIERNTAFYSSPPRLPDEDTLFDIQSGGEDLLANAGLSNYEVSAFSRENRQAEHNLNYWHFGDYMGLGAGAHSKVTEPGGSVVRYARVRMPDTYLDSNAAQRVCNTRVLAADELAGDFMLNALRLTRGFSKRLFEERTGLPLGEVSDRLQSLVARELIEVDGELFRTTALGRRFLDTVVAEFV